MKLNFVDNWRYRKFRNVYTQPANRSFPGRGTVISRLGRARVNPDQTNGADGPFVPDMRHFVRGI